MDIPEANTKILKRCLLFAAMALLFGAVNLEMYSYLPQEFVRKYYRFEADLPLVFLIMIVVSFGFIPAAGFSAIFRRYEGAGANKASKVSLFLKGLMPGFIGLIFLGIFCLKGLGQTSTYGGPGIIITFLILLLFPCITLGGIARIMLAERRFVAVLVTVMVFAGGMSSYLSLKVFISLFFG
jgi:hypothetical protein